MTFPGFYALTSAWLFLLLIPLLVFYFLKLKRPQKQIPSLALWRQVINDQRVNSPFQKFKRNLLLLLQLLLLTLLILAAMQPFIPSGAERAEYLPVLIDCSASMAATDEPGGPSRLDLAKERVEELIENLLPDQRLSLIAVHSTARRLTDFTNNKRILHDALKKVKVEHAASELEDALRMTQALSRTQSIKTVVVLTDGNLPSQIDFELPFELNYQKLPSAGTNLGITAFNARRTRATSWDIFVRVESAADRAAATADRPVGAPVDAGSAKETKKNATSGKVQLIQDGQPVAEDSVILDPGESQRLVFRVDTKDASSLEARLIPDEFDALELDNQAYLELPVGRPLTVYCPPEMAGFRHALQSDDQIVLSSTEDEGGPVSGYDLAISDRPEDLAVEAKVSLLVGIVPEELQPLVSVTTGYAEIVDWQRSDRFLQHVELQDVQITDQPVLATGAGTADFEQLGFEVIAHGRTGPLMLKKRTGERLAYYLLFHPDRSTLPYRVAFPILVVNAVQIALQESALAEVRARSTGLLPERTLVADRTYEVVGPGGQQQTVVSQPNGVLSGVPASDVGQYQVREGGKTVARIGVSLLAPLETSLVGVDELQFRELSVGAAESTLKSDHPFWPVLSLLAFGLLLVEWWYFQRRPGGAIA